MMILKKFLLIVLTFAIFPVHLFCNGGPIDYGAVIKTGRIKLLSLPEVKITKEHIDINIEGDYVLFDITYHLKAEELWQGEKLFYGFPVDFADVTDIDPFGFVWVDDYIPYFEIFKDGEKLEVIEQIDYTTLIDTAYSFAYDLNGWKRLVKHRRKWYIVNFMIDENSDVVLNVKYKVKSYFFDMLFAGLDLLPRYSKRYFKYDLSPARVWGKGVIDDFSISFNAKYLEEHHEKFAINGMKPSSYKDGIYYFNSKNLQLEEGMYLEVGYEDSNAKSSKLIAENICHDTLFRNLTSFVKPNRKSKLSDMFDLDFSTAYTFKNLGKKETEWMEFEFDTLQVFEIRMLNGNYKDEESYYSSCRIKKLKVDLEYLDLDLTEPVIKNENKILEFPYRKFCKIDKSNFANSLEIIWPYNYGNIKIKLTILEVYPGKKDSDICISELIFVKSEWKQ